MIVYGEHIGAAHTVQVQHQQSNRRLNRCRTKESRKVAGHVVSIGSRTQAGQYVGGRNRIHGRQVLRSLGARGADASSTAPMRVMPHLDPDLHIFRKQGWTPSAACGPAGKARAELSKTCAEEPHGLAGAPCVRWNASGSAQGPRLDLGTAEHSLEPAAISVTAAAAMLDAPRCVIVRLTALLSRLTISACGVTLDLESAPLSFLLRKTEGAFGRTSLLTLPYFASWHQQHNAATPQAPREPDSCVAIAGFE